MSCKFSSQNYNQRVYLSLASGTNGYNGVDGATGPRGDTGPTGSKGDTGATGLKGDTGAQGPQGTAGSADAWGLLGNAGTVSGTNFLGTTDNQALLIKINGIDAIRITAKGQIEFLGGSTTIDSSIFMGINAGSFATSSTVRTICIGNNAGSQLGRFGAGNDCTVIGYDALKNMNTNNSCVAYGNYCLQNCTMTQNCGYGLRCMQLLTSGAGNHGFGIDCMSQGIVTGSDNSAYGSGSLIQLTSGINNCAYGNSSSNSLTTASNTTSFGYRALRLSNASNQTAIGSNSLASLSAGSGGNTCLGYQSGSTITSGSGNIGIGTSHTVLTTGSENILIGNGLATQSAGESNTCRIKNIRGVTTINADAIAVLVSSTGQLGTVSSTREKKENIIAMEDTTNLIKLLKPSSFNFKCHCYADCKDGCVCGEMPCTHGCQCHLSTTVGLIYDEVEPVIPAICVKNAEGNPETIQYHLLPIYMLRCMQEQIKKQEALEARIAQLENIISTLNV